MGMKKVLVMGDTHCGHWVGLTPPGWWANEKGDSVASAFANQQRQCWEFFCNKLEKYKPFDVLIHAGDCIDGKGERSGGTELIEPDRNEQVNMALKCIKQALSKKTKVVMVAGTPYHTGMGEDFEQQIADRLDTKLHDHASVEVSGVTFDVKHKIGSSNIPHGRHTAMARERAWNIMWNDHMSIPKADVLLRGHVHYYDFCGGSNWLGMTLPALQGLGSKYGARQCSGTVDFGFVVFTINEGEFQWQPELLKIEAEKLVSIKM